MELKSYARSQGRITKGQLRIFNTKSPTDLLSESAGELNFEMLFGDNRSVIVEIGFGSGEGTASLANVFPQLGFLGSEVYRPGVASLIRSRNEKNLSNLFIYHGDGRDFLRKMIPDSSISAIFSMFPDPWIKRRQQKRRLFQPAFVSLLASKLKEGGIIYYASDSANYAEYVLELLSGSAELRNAYSSGFASAQEWRPLSKYAKKAVQADLPIYEVLFKKGAGPIFDQFPYNPLNLV